MEQIPDNSETTTEQLEDPIERRKILSILAHASILLGLSGFAILIPLAIVIFSKDSVVIKNAKEALNFYLVYLILGTISFFLSFFIVGIPFLIILIISSFISPIIAILKIAENPNLVYRYFLLFRFV